MDLKKNLWYFFIFQLSQRRHFIPILSIYFLSLPNTTAQQIGLYTGIGYLAAFLLEIPSSYFADVVGHKKTLIMAKVLMIISLLCFIFANGFIWFVLGSACLSASFAFTSGTDAAFMHNTLIAIKRGKDYTKVMSKNAANVSLLSAILIILLPLTTRWDLVLPLKINLVFDIIGLWAVFMLANPPKRKEVEEYESTFKTLKRSVNYKFLPIVLFTGLVGGFLSGDVGFRSPYFESLGYPIMLLGLVMGMSRVVWFGVGHYAHLIKEKIGVRRLLQIEIFAFPLMYLLIVFFKNPFVVGGVYSVFLGYYWGRNRIIEHYILDNCVKNKKYKATVLSIAQQIQTLYEMVIAFLIGFVMSVSYRLGFAVLGIALFIAMIFLYHHAQKHLKENPKR